MKYPLSLTLVLVLVFVLSACHGQTAPDGGMDSGSADSGGSDVDGGMDAGLTLVNCGSLFAARILEMQQQVDPSFDGDCDSALVADIGAVSAAPGADPACHAGESPNACRDRVYAVPPPLGALAPGCASTTPAPPGCLRGAWLPRCADGSEDGCVEDELVCQDGTRPLVYAEGSTTGSNLWVIHMGGEGQPCQADKCWFNYRFAEEFSGKREFETAMSTFHPDHSTRRAITGSGITNGVQTNGAFFPDFNRVKFNRCSDSAGGGDQAVRLFDADQGTLGESTVFHRGRAIWKGLFRSLTTPSGRDLDGDGVPDLPSLADAQAVLLVGSSDASEWLSFSADALAEELRAIAGPGVRVGLVIDGYFDVMLDSEGRYAAADPAAFDLLASPYDSVGYCDLPTALDPTCATTCSDSQLRPGPAPDGAVTIYDDLELRHGVLDASCVAMHGGNSPQCHDRMHVQFQHVSTPTFIVADQEDSVISNAPVTGAENACYRWSDPDTYRQRILDQARDLHAHFPASREEGADAQLTLMLHKQRRGAQAWSVANHTHLGNDAKIQWVMTRCAPDGTPVGSVSIGGAIRAWLEGTMPTSYVVEDAAAWDGGSAYWVTGEDCGDHE